MSGFRRYLFAGDAATAQATQVPSMEQAGDGKVLSVKSNVQAYNTWQETVLDDNVYEIYRAEILPTQNSWNIPSGTTRDATTTVTAYQTFGTYTGTTVFNFEFLGMTQMKRIFLDYLWSLFAAYRPTYTSGTGQVPTRVQDVFVRQGMGGFKISDLPQPEFMMLDAISRVQFIIGKNKLQFENGNVESLQARKVHMSSNTYTPAEKEQIAQLGLSYAKNVPNYSSRFYEQFNQAIPISATHPLAPNNFSTPTNTWPNASPNTYPSLDPNSNIFDYFFEQSQNALFERTYPQQPSTPFYSCTNGNCNITVPLFCLIPFLSQTDTFLPKSLPIEIRIDWRYEAGSQLLESNWMYSTSLARTLTDAGRDLVPYINNMQNMFRSECSTYAGIELEPQAHVCPFVFSVTQPQSAITIRDSIRIVYDYILLKENILKEFNLTWARQPLLFNYYSWERFDTIDKMSNNNSSTINYNLLINQQRPLALYFRFEIRNPRSVQGRQYTADKEGNRYLLNGIQNIHSLMNTGSEIRLHDKLPIFNYETGSCAGHAINLIEIFVGSQMIYRADSKSLLGLTFQNVNSVIDNLYTNGRDNSQGVFYESINLAQLSMNDNATAYKVDLSQNKAYERGWYALDRGNTNLTINVRLNSPMNTDKYTLAIYAKYPAQMTIDRSYTCVETKWPVIIAENGPVVESQYNIN